MPKLIFLTLLLSIGLLPIPLYATSHNIRSLIENQDVVSKEDLKKKETELFVAVEEHDLDQVRKILNMGIDPNAIGDRGMTPLMVASKSKDVDIARVLLKYGADVNYRSERIVLPLLGGPSVLDYAALSGDTVIVNFLLRAGATLNPEEKTNNPAIIAASSRNFKMSKYLFQQGAKISESERLTLIAAGIRGSNFSCEKKSYRSNDDYYRLQVRFWMELGEPIDTTELKKIAKENFELDEKIIAEYWESYNEKTNKEVETKQLHRILSRDFEPSREQDLIKEKRKEEKRIAYEKAVEKKIEKEKIEKEKIEKEKYRARWRKFLLAILIVGGISVFVYKNIQKKENRITSSFNQQSYPNFSTNVRVITRKPTPVKQQSVRVEVHNKKSEKIRTTPIKIDKGWDRDTTIGIEVTLLTIEDMINPIRLRNEHEKAVRDMINYIRQISKSADTKNPPKLGFNGLSVELNSLWATINPAFVRAIYKKSLYIIVEDYSHRDERVLPILKKMGRSISNRQ